MDSFFSRRQNQVLASLALLMTIIALGMYAQYTWKQAQYLYSGPTTISVSGEGEVAAVPDIGQFSFSVIAKAENAAAARDAAAGIMDAVLAKLGEQGIDKKDVRTDSYNLTPQYRYEAPECRIGMYCPGGEQIEDGFEVAQTVSVKVRDLDTIGDVLSGVTESGATNVSGLNFTIDDSSDLKEEARSLAIKDAEAKAEILARELGVRLERMVGYYEDESGSSPYYARGDMMMANEGMDTKSVSVPTGENVTKSRVTITYQVK